MSESAPSDSSSLERESVSSSSSSSSYGSNGPYRKVGVIGEEKKERNDTLSLSFYNFRELKTFVNNNSKQILSLRILEKYKQVLNLMDELGAFTKTSLLDFCQELGIKIGHKSVKSIIEILNMFEVIDYEMVRTTLLPAEIYFFPKVESSEKRFHMMKEKYEMRWKLTNPALKNTKRQKDPEDIKQEMKEKWKAQAEAAIELKKEQQEANTCKRLLTQGVTCASQFQKKYWCEVCLSEDSP